MVPSGLNELMDALSFKYSGVPVFTCVACTSWVWSVIFVLVVSCL